MAQATWLGFLLWFCISYLEQSQSPCASVSSSVKKQFTQLTSGVLRDKDRDSRENWEKRSRRKFGYPLGIISRLCYEQEFFSHSRQRVWFLPFVFLNTLTKRSLWLFLCYAVPRNKNKTEVLGRILTKIITQEASTLRIYQSICP